jgi:hypothetical protein
LAQQKQSSQLVKPPAKKLPEEKWIKIFCPPTISLPVA